MYHPKIPFGKMFSKITFKSSSDVLIFRYSQKIESAVFRLIKYSKLGVRTKHR